MKHLPQPAEQRAAVDPEGDAEAVEGQLRPLEHKQRGAGEARVRIRWVAVLRSLLFAGEQPGARARQRQPHPVPDEADHVSVLDHDWHDVERLHKPNNRC